MELTAPAKPTIYKYIQNGEFPGPVKPSRRTSR
ncbi:MAG: AlpA family phage regulatory protein [Epsilonproteobacteria bacterium]|nr:AlpA family phage regulatory protein [Campylobacterota bacterium]